MSGKYIREPNGRLLVEVYMTKEPLPGSSALIERDNGEKTTVTLGTLVRKGSPNAYGRIKYIFTIKPEDRSVRQAVREVNQLTCRECGELVERGTLCDETGREHGYP